MKTTSAQEQVHLFPMEGCSKPELSLLWDTWHVQNGSWANQRARQRKQLQVVQGGHKSPRHTVVPEGWPGSEGLGRVVPESEVAGLW